MQSHKINNRQQNLSIQSFYKICGREVTPQLLPFTFGDDPLNTDDVAAVQCMALKGDLPMKIAFYFNDSPITTIENGIHVVMTSPRIAQLTIEAVSAYHRGWFKCIASNAAGSAEHSAELRVNGTSRDKKQENATNL